MADLPGCVSAGFIKHDPMRMEDFAVTCQLVPVIPHLRSGSCTSPHIFGLGFLQTTPRDVALALLLALGSANTWRRDLHPASYVPCPAHTAKITCWNTRCTDVRYLKRPLAEHINSDSHTAVPGRLIFFVICLINLSLHDNQYFKKEGDNSYCLFFNYIDV
jgi:hypothetical protein